jgi:hypothetical protein
MRAAIVLASVGLLGVAGIMSACGDDETGPSGGLDASTSNDAADATTSKDSGVDANEPSTCEITRAYFVACGEPLTCGEAKFDAWCEANDRAINSASFRRAQARCLTKDNCDGEKRRQCEYESYATATPTAAQQQVVAAYCQTCEPGDPTGCASRKKTYVPGSGSKSVDDVFVAAWELSDPVADEIRTKCTGGALDAGADAGDGGCLKAFANCAGDVYIGRLPDCP